MENFHFFLLFTSATIERNAKEQQKEIADDVSAALFRSDHSIVLNDGILFDSK
jgi:hypothetical protein